MFQPGDVVSRPATTDTFRILDIDPHDQYATLLRESDHATRGSWLLPEDGWHLVATVTDPHECAASETLARVRLVREGWARGHEPVHHKGYIADLDRALDPTAYTTRDAARPQ